MLRNGAKQLGIIALLLVPLRPSFAQTAPATAQASQPGEAAAALHDEALRLYRSGRFAEAETLFRRALEASEQAVGRDHPDTLASASNLAAMLVAQGRYAEAEPLRREVLRTNERARGPEHPDTLTAVNNLALLLRGQGRYAEAEPLYDRALEARERVLGRDHPATLTSVNNLAGLFVDQGRNAEAEPLLRRALEGRDRLLGPAHPETLSSVNNLALVLRGQGRYAEAEPLHRRALEASERLLGPEHPDALNAANSLAFLLQDQARHAEAEALFRRAVEGNARILGREHPATLVAVSNLATALGDQGRHAEAEPLFRRVHDASQRVLGADHPDTLIAAENLVISRLGNRDPSTDDDAVAPARSLLAGLRARRADGRGEQQARLQSRREQQAAGPRFALFADAAWASSGPRAALFPETLAALQESTAGAADRAVVQQAALRYAGSRAERLRTLAVRRQALEDRFADNDDLYARSYGDGESGTSLRAQLRTERAQIERELGEIDRRLQADFPDYFDLIRPRPTALQTVRDHLGADEALLLAVPSRFGTHVVAIARDGEPRWVRSVLTDRLVGAVVRRLRWTVDQTTQASEQENAQWRDGRAPDALPPYPLETAFGLHQQLIAPVADLLRGKSRVYIVGGGPLAALPFSMLVAALPAAEPADETAALRATRWFGDDQALIHLPSVQSFVLLRQARVAARRAGSAFLGVGNPLLSPLTAARRRTRGNPIDPQALFPAVGGGARAPLADVRALRAMASLPGTGIELEAVRGALRAPATALLTQAAATEPAVRARNGPITRAGIILFSTHGLTSDQATGVGEPGLVLTPPAEGSEADDGYLSASEVTTLRLDADWVILSACNTATGDRDGELSALARAFFYAGARNLLASHWPVADDVAPILITRTLALDRGTSDRPSLSRAEAFRQAVREIRMHPGHPEWSHPFYWAPFVLIGDGGP